MIFIIYGGQFGNTRDTYMLCWAQYELEQFSAAALPFNNQVYPTWCQDETPSCNFSSARYYECVSGEDNL